jgi:choline dehydrogenase-like flavoprotein
MRRSAEGFWLADAGPVEARPALAEAVSADVVVIGGGYLGMWAAWHLRAAGADVVLLESGVCGHGPSGRNGGFLNGMWERAGELAELFGRDAALAIGREAAASIENVDAWSMEHGVDAHVVRAPFLEVSAAPGQDGAWDGGVAGCRSSAGCRRSASRPSRCGSRAARSSGRRSSGATTPRWRGSGWTW